MKTAEERFRTNGLVTFVQGLVGMKVYAELRAGTIAIGKLTECDRYLNLRIRNAVLIRARQASKFEEFFVCGRHLRYVHLEHVVDVGEILRRATLPSRLKAATSKKRLVAKTKA
ncbi:unnamed protein product [Cylicocyclus nassatus]|uniref:Sm domain-containing protein n=1 Tax=Cylicocyclus nassatus TaxID=53992 RepID=A0AA36GLP2_CYLNA|nr:unnamed protein product [Cylicocyclus nassatus]